MKRKPKPKDPTGGSVLSILFRDDGEAYIWDIHNRYDPTTPQNLQRKIDEVRAIGRKRWMVWLRPRHIAQPLGVSPVIWIGHPDGPGSGAYQLGWVHIDKLHETLLAHMGMVA